MRATPEFGNQEAFLIVTAEAIILKEASATLSADCGDILPANLDILFQFTKSYLDNTCWLAACICNNEVK